jgi:hypothetical protein
VLIIGLIGIACNFSQPVSTATTEPTLLLPTQPPSTVTSIPTNTPLPTDTPKPTPDKKATQSALATDTAQKAIDLINAELEGTDFSVDTGYLGWIQDEPYSIELKTYRDSLYSEFAEDLVASDFIIKTDVTWNSEGLVYCGFLMRSEKDFVNGKQYAFNNMRFSGLPAWDIEFWNNGEFQNNVTGKVRFSDALNLENGSTNTFIIAVEGNEFTVYINGDRQGRFYDYSNQATEGQFAWIGFQESGPSNCTFENSWIWVND